MGLISAYMAALTALNFIILWGGIYFLAKWIPPGNDIPAWKAGVMAAAITVFAMLLSSMLSSVVTPS